MYKIGDKVETPQFTGIIEKVYESGVKVNGKMFPFKNIKPYKSAHKKLLALGYICKTNNSTIEFTKEFKEKYARYGTVITIQVKEKSYSGFSFYDDLFNSQYRTHEMKFDLTLSRILTQYLEELEAKE